MIDDVFLVVDKPQGLTSQQVVAKVKRQLGCRKVGHTGTLDPLATGVLPLALNRATKLIQYLDESRKVYSGEIELGIESDTLDRDGEVIFRYEGSLDFSDSEITEVMTRYNGSLTQVAPIYSAIKRKGRPLYSYARAGVEVTPPERQIEIDSFTLLAYNPPLLSFRVVCSKGTYVRSLAADLGRDLGCGARIWSLRREASGSFTIDQAISLDKLLEKASRNESLPLRPPLEYLGHLQQVVIDDAEMKEKVSHGMALSLATLSLSTELADESEVAIVDEVGVLLALARLELCEHGLGKELRMLRVMMAQS